MSGRNLRAAPWLVALILGIAFAGSAAAAQELAPEPVDLNTATSEQLQSVPGIGPATAGRILEWRKTHGPFERVEDLLNIRGIGPTTLEKLRPYVTVAPRGGARPS